MREHAAGIETIQEVSCLGRRIGGYDPAFGELVATLVQSEGDIGEIQRRILAKMDGQPTTGVIEGRGVAGRERQYLRSG